MTRDSRAVIKSYSLLVIAGPTASGKSALAMRIAKGFNGEIISADSWQVYRGFDVGTAKPSIAQQKEVKHHLIDVVDAKDGFNAPKFKKLAEKAIADIQNRAKLPILVGGTGLYIDSVLFDFGFLPDVAPDERAKLNSLTITELIEVAGRRRIDLSGIDIRNKRRIIRAIEAKGEKPTKKGIIPGTLIVGLKLAPDELRKRLEQRIDQMIEEDLEQEVKQLSERYGWDIEPMKGIGYQEFKDFFDGKQDLEQTKRRIISATTNLAKRQRTWFKRNSHIHWFDNTQKACEFIQKKFG